MLGDRERSGAYVSEQRRLVRDSLAAEVLAFTTYWRDAAAEAGLGKPAAAGDLTRLRPRPIDDLGPPDALVVRPSPDAVRKSGPRPLRRRLRRARLGRHRSSANRRIVDPLYKAVHWFVEGDVPVGCTEADLVRLAELGRRSLELAGIGVNDAIVGLVPPGPTLASWQLALGAREAGVALAGLTPWASIESVSLLGPTVLAGRPPDLLRVLEGLGGPLRSTVSTVLALSRSPLAAGDRRELEAAAGTRAAVVEAWSPLGVRALWTQCRGGEGVHTWPQSELVEVCGADGTPVTPGSDGELVWTGLGWRGTAFVRLATGVRGQLIEGRCETCGRTTPRIMGARVAAAPTRSEAEAEADAEAEAEAAGLEVAGPAKATGVLESVRTLRKRRSKSPRRDRATSEEPAPADARVEEVVLSVPPDQGLVFKAEAIDDEEGVVRAVPKELDDDAEAQVPPPMGAVGPGDVVDLNHLPPVPEVGPDAAGGSRDEAWLPETGEVDAWPAPVLASIDGLAAWQVEHRRRKGHDELVVHIALTPGASLADALVALERSVGANQYVVTGGAELAQRIAAAGGIRIVDRRDQGRTSRRASASTEPARWPAGR